MRRAAWICLLGAAVACGEKSSPTSPTPSDTSRSVEPVLSALEVESSVLGGQPARATVTLGAPAPTQDVSISLSASGTAATIPSSVTVPGGATSVAFEVATTRVAVTTDIVITARAGGMTRTASLRLRIDPTGLAPSANYTIGFSSLRENRAAVTMYVESGFTISPVSAPWVAITTYGNPLPSLQFFASGGTVTGELQVTADGAPFWLRSVDLYSSVTRIPYVIEGILSGEAMFVQLAELGNTFGNFVRVANSRPDLPVDRLNIRLSNPVPPGLNASNPMGVDNIILNR
jgi:hypothetical protein